MLHLNTDSAVTVRYSRAERLVSLDRGQALFEVAHQDERRLRVQTDRAGVVGGRNAVRRLPQVRRDDGHRRRGIRRGLQRRAPPPPVPSSVRLNPGDQLDVGDRIGALRHVDARAAVAWLQRQIAFQDEPLGEVAAEFNRYGPITVEINDASLRALPISGIVDAYDTDSFAAYLATLSGVIVQKTPTRIRVLTARIAGAACRRAVESQATKQAEWSMERRSLGMLRSLPRADSRRRAMARARPSAPPGQWLACCLLGMLLSGWAGTARSAAELSAPIASQPLAQALVEFAHQTGLQLLYESKLAAQRQSHKLRRACRQTDALTEMLQGTGLNFQFLNPKTVRIFAPAAVAPAVTVVCTHGAEAAG